MSTHGQKDARQLWQDYAFFTSEMSKFLLKEDMELFYKMMEEREKLQTTIRQCAAEYFVTTSEGQVILQEIERENVVIKQHLQARINNARQRKNIVSAYDGYGGSPVPGRRIDSKQ